MEEYTPQELQQRATYAKQLQDNPIYIEAMLAIKAHTYNTFNSAPHDRPDVLLEAQRINKAILLLERYIDTIHEENDLDRLKATMEATMHGVIL